VSVFELINYCWIVQLTFSLFSLSPQCAMSIQTGLLLFFFVHSFSLSSALPFGAFEILSAGNLFDKISFSLAIKLAHK